MFINRNMFSESIQFFFYDCNLNLLKKGIGERVNKDNYRIVNGRNE